MPIVRREDRPVLVRERGLPTLQRLVDRAGGSEAVTVLVSVSPAAKRSPGIPTRSKRCCWSPLANAPSPWIGRPGIARAGDAVIVPPGTRHAIRHDSDQPCQVIAVLAAPDAQIGTAT